jgi:DNA-binding transcriptional regulator/RsmH inhibitor MraZ
MEFECFSLGSHFFDHISSTKQKKKIDLQARLSIFQFVIKNISIEKSNFILGVLPKTGRRF